MATYLVTATHPTGRVKFDREPFEVRKDALDGYYVVHGKLGCGRTRETPQMAIRDICGSHAISVQGIEEKPAPRTLNRQEALGLIEGCEAEREPNERLHVLQDLSEHWIGHRNAEAIAGPAEDAAAELAQLLAEYVAEVASPRDDRTPRATDPTDLTAPAGWEL